ncbi:hypothetical protein JTE90_016471 [Oedothorax gibbosus]|uniref:Nose resistant-to-fluoxetine protein N-terminal domain-containing protein n=1 Tax=Oedothorax gibbosus TaxID=931172 RepID=A0AAV6V4T5_9ARAC|nr:hypothetical protein JTE90_016471 [Oedothorax gibbosus]
MFADKLLKLILVVLISCVLEAYALKANSNKLTEDPLKWPSLQKKFQQAVGGILNGHRISQLHKISDKVNASKGCKNSLIQGLLALTKWEGWAVHMVDASGKLPSGILDGTGMDLGSFEECLKIRYNDADGTEEFRGRHCMIGFRSPMVVPLNKNTSTGQTYEETFGHPPDWVSDFITKTGGYYNYAALWFGVCVPSTCSGEDIKQIATFVSQPLKMNVLTAGCQIDEPVPWSISALVSICILCVFIGCCLIGTVTDAVFRCLAESHQSSIPDYFILKVLKAFSLLSNTEKLFTSSTTGDTLGCFHGIRFLSATWIILGHTYFFTDTWKFLRFKNGLQMSDAFNYYLPNAVMENFSIPVGSFFFMSGFLLVYVTWKKLESNQGRINLIMFFIHKYWRMVPALGLMIILFLALPAFGSGPLWYSTLDPPVHACERLWWTNLLFINNFWGSEDYCLIHTWYLAALMQFHLIGVCLLVLSYRWPVIGMILGFVLAVGSCAVTAILVVWNNFPMPAPGFNKDMETMKDYNTKIYIKPFCHATSYLIGMFVALFVLKYKPQRIQMHYQILCWTLAIASALFAVYGLYLPASSVGVRAFYMSFHRIAWAVGVGWLVFACITGHGGIINRFLSWQAFAPLGHLSYLVYLLHPLVMLYRTASLRERINYGHTEMVFEFLNYTLISFFLAFIGHVAVEKPFLILDGLFFKRQSPHILASKTCQSEESPTLTKGVKTIIP